MAGLNEWDIMLTQSLFITPTFMLSNLILPVSDYIEFEDDPVLNDGFVKNIVTYKGKQWGIPFAMSLPGFPVSLPNNNFGFIYNEDILNTEGLPDLLELDLQGRWNWDKLVEIGSSATHDYNGDGIVDQWGMALFGPNPVIHIVAANKGTIISYENGRYEFAINDSASLRALTFISDLFNTYKIATIDGKAFKNGKALMDPFYIGRGQITPYVTAGMDTSKIKMVRYPMGPDNPDGKPTLTVNVSVSLIPATSIDPEGIAKFMAVFFQTYNHPDLIVNPDEALAGDIDFIFGDAPGLLDYWIRMRRLVDNDVINYGAWGTPFTGVGTLLQGQLLTNISNPGISIKNYIESIRTSLQNDIDTVAIQ